MIELDPSLNRVPRETQHIHIMGICGTGMAALAGMLQQSGFIITGSDSHVYPPMSEFLAILGINVCNGYGPQNLTPRPDLVIVGNVITKKNPESAGLKDSGIPYLSFPQALSHLHHPSYLACSHRNPRQNNNMLPPGNRALQGRA